MRRFIWLVALVVGCGSEAAAPAESCGPRAGLYRATYVTRSGDCGAIPEAVINFDDPAPAGCTSKYPSDTASCRVMGDVTCPADGMPTSKVNVKGVTTWQPGGASGAGVVSFAITEASGKVACQGTYDVTYTKL